MSYTWCAQPRNNARIVRERREIWRTELSESGPACLRSWEDLVDVADRDVARVSAVRVSATAKIHRELEHGHVEREVFGLATNNLRATIRSEVFDFAPIDRLSNTRQDSAPTQSHKRAASCRLGATINLSRRPAGPRLFVPGCPTGLSC